MDYLILMKLKKNGQTITKEKLDEEKQKHYNKLNSMSIEDFIKLPLKLGKADKELVISLVSKFSTNTVKP